jgi:amino acid transporter
MGREAVLPARAFGYLHPRLRTPVFNLVLMGVVMLAGEWLDVETAASCVNFGAFMAFLAVNLCVLWDHRGEQRQMPGGRIKLLQAALGAVGALWLIVSLHKTALTIGILWLCMGLFYVCLRTRGFRAPLRQSRTDSKPSKRPLTSR